ncbi:MAG TPA: Tat pathway signal protein [Porticoccaceae bacterium]|nr:Tat pathway signal protein [Porticoccaceae bacterium]
MALKITRRDFLNGMAIGTGVSLLIPGQAIAQASGSLVSKKLSENCYPPTLTGMRGSHKGSYEVAHALAWKGQKPADYEELDEHYDLVVVGAGQSGLAAAWYYRKKMGPTTKILLLDNHDDFGGHAKRNEFHLNGRMVLSLGGAQNIEPMSGYSETAIDLLEDIGIDQKALDLIAINTPNNFALSGKISANNAMTIPSTEGHKTVTGNWMGYFHGGEGYREAVKELPISGEEQNKLIAFFGGERDFLDDLSLLQQYRYVKSVSYNQFLIERVGLAEETLPILGSFMSILNGPAGWNHTVLEALVSGCPGLKAMGWVTNRLSDLAGAVVLGDAPVAYMLPDGNASVARLLVHKLIPNVAPSMKGLEDVALAQFNYLALDLEKNTTRLRLNSTVVGVKEITSKYVQVDYVQKGKALRVSANNCVLACYNGLIPHLCPEMSNEQKEGLSYGVKIPFVYANVLLNHGRHFAGLGATLTQCPYDPFKWVSAAPTMTAGGYQPPQNLDDPMAVFMMASPTPADVKNMSARELFRVGRHKIYTTPFKTYEQEIRDQLQSMLGQYGFNHDTDIAGITINRIPHGYAYSYMGLDDPEWQEGQAPHEIGRVQFGRISIANADSEAMPLMQAAFDAAWRAVEEQST